MVVLILVALWVAALAPLGLRRLRERRGTASIDSFHEQLHTLERAGPKLVPAAHRLETAFSHTGLAPGQSGFPAVTSGTGPRPNLVLVSSSSTPIARHSVGGRPGGVASQAGWASHDARAAQRRRARRRRRDVVVGLGLTVLLTGSLGALHGLHLLWVVTVLGVLALAGCVGLAAYAQLLDADQRAGQPVRARRTAPWDWADEGSRRVAGPAVGEGARQFAAKSGYPGAWDDDAVAVPRAATGG